MTSSLAPLAAEAAERGTLDTILNSWAGVGTIVGVFILISAYLVSRAIYKNADAHEAVAQAIAASTKSDIQSIVRQVLAHIGPHIEDSVGAVRNEALDHVERLDGNDAVIAGGVQEVATRAGVGEITMVLAGTDWTRGGKDAPAGTTWATDADVIAARTAVIQGDAHRVAADNRSISAPPPIQRTANINEPFNPTNADSIMDYLTERSLEQYNEYPWVKVRDERYEPGTRYYDLVREAAEKEFGLPLPKTLDDLWNELSEDARLKFKALSTKQY